MTKSIWIDFENAPHVWVLSPIINLLRKNGCSVLLTARNFSYTVTLCKKFGYDIDVIGLSGTGKNKADKALRLLIRSLKLYVKLFFMRNKIAIAISHGSRSQMLVSWLLGIRAVSLDDYEFSNQSFVRFIDHLLVPFPIPKVTWGKYSKKIVHYPGLKEELYLCTFKENSESIDFLNNEDQVKVLFRPEGQFSHYRSEKSRILQSAVLDRLRHFDNVFLVLLPRDQQQAKELSTFCEDNKISYWIPEHVLDGPNLIWKMDLVVSGGGTMTREAAVLDVPSYSFFGGKWGAVDQYLMEKEKLFRIDKIEDAKSIKVVKRKSGYLKVPDEGLTFISDFIFRMLEK